MGQEEIPPCSDLSAVSPSKDSSFAPTISRLFLPFRGIRSRFLLPLPRLVAGILPPPLGQRSGLERLGRLASSIVFFLCPVKRNSRTEEGPVDVLRSKCGARASVYACIELPYADAQHSRSSEGKNSAVLSPAFLRLLRRIRSGISSKERAPPPVHGYTYDSKSLIFICKIACLL